MKRAAKPYIPRHHIKNMQLCPGFPKKIVKMISVQLQLFAPISNNVKNWVVFSFLSTWLLSQTAIKTEQEQVFAFHSTFLSKLREFHSTFQTSRGIPKYSPLCLKIICFSFWRVIRVSLHALKLLEIKDESRFRVNSLCHCWKEQLKWGPPSQPKNHILQQDLKNFRHTSENYLFFSFFEFSVGSKTGNQV